jgi:hypothetical protein
MCGAARVRGGALEGLGERLSSKNDFERSVRVRGGTVSFALHRTWLTRRGTVTQRFFSSTVCRSCEFSQAGTERIGFRRDHRRAWAATHPKVRFELDWLCPGRVWAMDLHHPPRPIDVCYPAIPNVLDLVRHRRLLWLTGSRSRGNGR